MCDSSDDEFKHLKECEMEYRKSKVLKIIKCTCEETKGVTGKKCLSHKKRKYISRLWKFYTLTGDKTAKCAFCDKILSYQSTVSNLKKHLMRSHRNEVIATFNNDDVKESSNDESMKSLATYVREAQFSVNEDDETNDMSAGKTTPIKKDCVSEDEDYDSKIVQEEDTEHGTEPSHEVLIEETYLDEDILRDDPPSCSPVSKSEAPKKYTLSRAEWERSVDRFGTYAVSLMKLLPRRKAARFQVQIIDRLIKETCMKK